MIVPIYIFAIAFVLAYLEVQIEGPNGWAAALPTWRVRNNATRILLGVRFLTGYHLALVVLLLLMFHLPVVLNGFNWALEAQIMMYFFYIAFVWDYLWFIINPFYGEALRRRETVWWFDSWWVGYPREYFIGALLGLGVRLAPALLGFESYKKGVLEGTFALGILVILSGCVRLIYSFLPAQRAVGAKEEQNLAKEIENV